MKKVADSYTTQAESSKEENKNKKVITDESLAIVESIDALTQAIENLTNTVRFR